MIDRYAVRNSVDAVIVPRRVDAFDTLAQIVGFVDTIPALTIDFDTTPRGDQTGMAQAERPTIGQQVAETNSPCPAGRRKRQERRCAFPPRASSAASRRHWQNDMSAVRSLLTRTGPRAMRAPGSRAWVAGVSTAQGWKERSRHGE